MKSENDIRFIVALSTSQLLGIAVREIAEGKQRYRWKILSTNPKRSGTTQLLERGLSGPSLPS